jgi:DNA-directed RNA polymerase subunit M/transcription elongation factor TFIIS
MCPRCSGCLITKDAFERDDRRANVLACLNCGWTADEVMLMNRRAVQTNMKELRRWKREAA